MKITNYTALSFVHVLGSLIPAVYYCQLLICVPSFAIFFIGLGYDTVVHIFEGWEEKKKKKDKHTSMLEALEAGAGGAKEIKKDV